MSNPALALLVRFKSRLSYDEAMKIGDERAPEFRALEGLQLERLQSLVERLAATNIPYYREQLGTVGPIRSLDALTSLPFTTKQTLRDHYPFGLLAEPLDRIVRIHASSGTTGR